MRASGSWGACAARTGNPPLRIEAGGEGGFRKIVQEAGIPIYIISTGNLFYKKYEHRMDPSRTMPGDPDRMTFPTTMREHYSHAAGDSEESSPDPAYTIML